MNIKKYNQKIKYLFHYTKKENLEKILKDKEIKVFNDKYTFFSTSYEDSCKLFKKLMMNESIYVNSELHFERREIQNADDYVILKLKATNDNNFFVFSYDAQGFNPYNYSILHNGNFKFNKYEVLKIDSFYSETNLTKPWLTNNFSRFKKFALTASAATLLMFCKLNISNATSWEESNLYDTSWYNYYDSVFFINSPEDLAGLQYLVNTKNITFSGETINILNDIDTTAYTWEEISSNFRGTFDGIHKIFIALNDNTTNFANSSINLSGMQIVKNYIIDTQNVSANSVVEPTGIILVQENCNKSITISANESYDITNVTIDNVSHEITNKSTFSYTFQNVNEIHSISVTTSRFFTHIKNLKNNILNTSTKTNITNYQQINPFDASYTEVIDGITYLYTYKDCTINGNIYSWNYEANIIEQSYTVLKGANQTYDNNDLVIEFSGDLSKVSKLFINNTELEAKNYTLKNGSTIVTLKKEFLNTLSEGKYIVKIEYKDGSAETAFTIAKTEDVVEPTSTKFDEIPVIKDSTPKTGKYNNIFSIFFLVVLLIFDIIAPCADKRNKN